ncbi:MAG: membrane protein insertion efficiency factor YidD [Planctomycetota bacterium]|nr:membrane protein insertion efficiency factor YidD [Planctomycetota bacterium]
MIRFIRNLLEWIFVRLIRFYQMGISPLIGPSCRYTPTCSQYTIDAIRKYGPISGMYRGIKRILRCHPWHPGGHDPP